MLQLIGIGYHGPKLPNPEGLAPIPTAALAVENGARIIDQNSDRDGDGN
jgi:hypothetical protein